MSNNRYLELDSSFRDRVRWPLAGQFEIPISQSGRKGRNDALDPVSLGAPITSWTSNLFDANTPGISVAGVVDSIGAANNVAATNTSQTFIITAPAGDLQQVEDYYINAVIRNSTIGDERRIISYTYLGTDSGAVNDRAQVTVDSAFANTFADGNTFVINDPTDVSNTSLPLFFIPAGKLGENSYAGCLLYNESLTQFRPISGYDFVTHLLEVDTSGTASGSQGPVTGWLITHNYSIRKEPPMFSGTTTAGTTNTIILPIGVNTTDDFYNNQYIRMTSGGADDEIRRIIDYVGSTMTVTVSPHFSVAVGINTFELLAFSYDNAVPFNYSGSMVSQQEEVCYELELLNLVLPNRTLKTSNGARIAFYPYVYVNLVNVTAAGAGNINVIYSNNPNASRMLFRAAIDDVPNLITSAFLKIDGDGMVQTVKFKPNDNLKFEVRLPNGEIFDTTLTENFSPLPPNANAQISALFSMKRLKSDS